MISVRYAWNRAEVQKSHVSCPRANMYSTAAASSHGFVRTILAQCVACASILTIGLLDRIKLDLKATMVQQEEEEGLPTCTAAQSFEYFTSERPVSLLKII